ncbi:MAG: hypothetical protein HXL38_001425 [Candidatus Saccharimonas sp.]|nr:MAG: hypothetical protein HXL38_001425 [Candidatus Saccharimonas sp.]
MLEKLTGQKTFKEAFKNVVWFKFTVIALVGIFLIASVVHAINNPAKPTAPVNTNTPAKPDQQQTAKTPKLVEKATYNTASGISFTVKKSTDLANQPYYNLQANISKNDPAWRNKAKEVIKFISEKTQQKDFSVSISDKSTGTDLLNWNTGKNKAIFYTYPVGSNESEAFDL